MCRLRNIALESVTEKCDRRTDRQTDGQSDPYVSLCFAGDTKMVFISEIPFSTYNELPITTQVLVKFIIIF